MSKVGSVVFSASEGYDPEVWDDTALIKQYDKALQSSRRELIRSRQERASGRGMKGKLWQIGDACRAVYSEDGEEYEGTVVHKNAANRSVVVRFHGYNNEEEIKERDLMESSGKDDVEQQIEQARLDMEDEEEEEGARDDFQVGDWCRAMWSEDGVIYEGVIISLDKKSGTAKVKFLGFGNIEEKSLEDLFMSKGEERRKEQKAFEEIFEIDQDNEEQVMNCPELLATLGNSEELGFESLCLGGTGKKKKDKKEKKDKKKDKSENKRKSKDRSSPSRSSRSSTQAFLPDQLPPVLKSPFIPPAAPFHTYPPMPQFSYTPYHHTSIPDQYQHQYATTQPYLPPPPPLQFPPSHLPPPPTVPDLNLSSDNTTVLHSMLVSWYMAGFHTGVYEGVKQASEKKNKKK